MGVMPALYTKICSICLISLREAVARIMEKLTKEGKTEATTEVRIVAEGHPSIHTNFVSLIKRKDTMSLSAETLHETEMATVATTIAMAGNGNTGNSGSRQTRSETYPPNFAQPSFPYSANIINHIVNVT